MADLAGEAKWRAERRFFSGMAAVILLTVVAGFTRSYFLRPILGEPPAPALGLTPLIHVHGILFTGWVLLLYAQARLVAGRRIELHRKLGIVAAGVAILMLWTGVWVALHGVVRGVAPGGMEPRRFLALPLFALLMFGALLSAGLWQRHNPQAHKRLMLLATIALLPPAIARWVIVYLGLGPPVVIVIATAFILPIVVWDMKARHRLHPATLWGGLALVLSAPLRMMIAKTGAWLALADRMVNMVQ